MRVIRVFICLIVSVVAINASAALPTRTWVSGIGDDAWPCSFTAPCKTLASAYSKTEVGGLITVKDAGAYGGMLITHSISVDGGGNLGSVLYGGGDGITINFTANDGIGNQVVLRGLSITSGYGGGYGVVVMSSYPTNVHIVDTTFVNTAVAVGMFPSAAGCTLRMDNVEGSDINGTGVILAPPAGTALKFSMQNVRIAGTGQGMSNAGVRIVSNSNGTIANSAFQHGKHGILIENANVHATIARTVLSENSGSGLHHNVGGITTILDGCTITGNGVGISNIGSSVTGFSNNAIAYNTQDVAGNMPTSVQGQ